MENYYAFAPSGEIPKEGCKVMNKIDIIKEIELDYQTQKIDLYNVIKESNNKKEFTKICTVDEYTFEQFKK